jgi:hypothetical protein
MLKHKTILYLFIVFFIFSCGPSAQEMNYKQKYSEDSLQMIQSFEIEQSFLTQDSLRQIEANSYIEIQEEHKKIAKMKIRSMQINNLKDTISSIGCKLDSISEYLKK